MLRGRFKLSPSHDMLPMRFKPDPMQGLVDYAPFTPDTRFITPAVRQVAVNFWAALSQEDHVSEELRELATIMHQRVAASA
jgi:hypothetical protein